MNDKEVITMTLALEGHYYVDAAIFAAEQKRIFRGSWQIAGVASGLTEPGCYRTLKIMGISFLIVRGNDGELRAFRNVCRHRGSILLDDEKGQCEAIVCPYHGWRYDFYGRLEDTPWFGENSAFDLANLSLHPTALELWRGLIFVSMDPDGPLEDQLGDLPAELTDTPIESMVEMASQSYRIPINWKAYLDQFTEYYHSPTVHAPNKAVGIQHYTAAPFRNGMVMESPPDAAFYGGKWIWGWPNWTISTFSGGAKLSRVTPLSPQETEVHFHFLFIDAGNDGEAARRRVIEATANIFAEDMVAISRLQHNFAAGQFEQAGPLHPVHERATAYFQQRVRDALSQDEHPPGRYARQ